MRQVAEATTVPALARPFWMQMRCAGARAEGLRAGRPVSPRPVVSDDVSVVVGGGILLATVWWEVGEMDAKLAVLASSAATTVVNLLATDAWDQVKAKVGALWRRFRPDQVDAIEAALARGHLEIGRANEMVALAVTKDWESRLLRLLASDAAVAAELTRVVDELASLMEARQVRDSVWQSAKASGRSTVIQVGGDATLGELPLNSSRHTGACVGAQGKGW